MGDLHGTFERTLDAKGRLILPAKLRTEFGATAYLTTHVDGCLALFDAQNIETKRADMRELEKNGSQRERMIARIWSSSTSELTIDAQGRIPLPQLLRTWADLGDDVLVLGVMDRVEIWSPEKYMAKAAEANLQLLDGADL